MAYAMFQVIYGMTYDRCENSTIRLTSVGLAHTRPNKNGCCLQQEEWFSLQQEERFSTARRTIFCSEKNDYLQHVIEADIEGAVTAKQ